MCVNTQLIHWWRTVLSRLSFQVCASRGQSIALLQPEGFETKPVNLSVLRNVVNKVCGPKDVSNKAEKGENFKQRNFELPEKG